MQQFAKCPFCSKTFEVMSEPSKVIRVDNRIRTAHIKCLPIQQPEPIKEAAE